MMPLRNESEPKGRDEMRDFIDVVGQRAACCVPYDPNVKALLEQGLVARYKHIPVGGPGPRGYYYATSRGRAWHRRYLAALNVVRGQFARYGSA